MKDKLSINIKIGSRIYPISINREEEERYRIAAKMLNETVNQYREQFNNSDTQDILAMAAFQFVLKYVDVEQKNDQESLLDAIEDVNDEITDFLKEKS